MVLSDAMVLAPTGIVTFYSDPAIPCDITLDPRLVTAWSQQSP